MGRPQVSAMRGVTARQEVSPSQKMLQLILSFLKMDFTLYPRAERRSQYSKRLAEVGKLLLASLQRLWVVVVLVTLVSQTKGQVISRWEAMQSSSLRVKLMQTRSCPQTFSAAAMVGLILELRKAGYLGREWETKTPLEAAMLNPMKPLEWAEDELVSPEGFSSFQATVSRFCLLISSMVLVRAVLPTSILASWQTNFPVFMVESQQPKPVLPILGGTLRATHHYTALPDCPMQVCERPMASSAVSNINFCMIRL